MQTQPDDEREAAELLDEEVLEKAAETAIRCKTCGAGMTWEPEADALSCAYCGTLAPVERGEGTIVERPLEAAGEAARGLGLAGRALACRSCGARLVLEGARTADLCAYCGSAAVLEQEAARNSIRPESLIPLDVGAAQVADSFRRWVRALWFRPSALKHAKTSGAVGIYVPFWTFDAWVDSDWTAESGTYYWVNVPTWTTVNGRRTMRMRRVRKIRWRPAAGARSDVYDDLLVNASRGLPDDLVQQLGAFRTEALVPYRPEYLAGWRAEEYQVDLEQGWERGRRRIEERQRARCAGDVPGDTHRRLAVRNRISDVRWKHVLLPIWSVQYRFRGKVYTVLVHGQSGRCVGRAPFSWVKIGLLVLAVAAAIAAFIAFGGGSIPAGFSRF